MLTTHLLADFAVVVQVILGTIALSSLLVKRHREFPRRPFTVWIMDTSKQALASSMVHFANVALAYMSGDAATDRNVSNPCVWYFLNILLDTTIGVGILYGYLRLIHSAAEGIGLTQIKSGSYGNPPQFSAWFKQLCLFIAAWFWVKITVVLILQLFPFLAAVVEYMLGPLERGSDSRAQVVVVMLLFPLCMNVLQAWLIDAVIKEKHDENGGAFTPSTYKAHSSATLMPVLHSEEDGGGDDEEDDRALLAGVTVARVVSPAISGLDVGGDGQGKGYVAIKGAEDRHSKGTTNPWRRP
ncbi:vacuolar membrane protein-domain-containing protein [Cladochytrium replicatum]|nr:vacuolar membrane protein-domain-containing protein [Cladochytrium replicatum]